VDQTVIKNMQEALQFYKVLAEDNKKRLEEIKEENTSLRKQNEDLEKEIKDLRKQVFDLMHFLCVDATCKLRKQDLKLFDNETKSRENS
jgi:predicted  nucleic acid-binding Zn-ribbon protein